MALVIGTILRAGLWAVAAGVLVWLWPGGGLGFWRAAGLVAVIRIIGAAKVVRVKEDRF